MSQMNEGARRSTPSGATTAGADVQTRVEQLHVRNFDRNRSYRLHIELKQPDNPPAHEGTLEIGPRGVSSELELAPPGLYDITVTASFKQLDGPSSSYDTGKTVTDTAQCNVGAGSAQTVVIECGNGIVSISEGLPA